MNSTKCPFCEDYESFIESDLIFAKWDAYPVTEGHALIIPKRHVLNYFNCTAEERFQLWELVDSTKKHLEEKYSPDGFNIGINIGEPAGQTVPHAHIHLIPRYAGDVQDPRGGVRGVIPNKQYY